MTFFFMFRSTKSLFQTLNFLCICFRILAISFTKVGRHTKPSFPQLSAKSWVSLETLKHSKQKSLLATKISYRILCVGQLNFVTQFRKLRKIIFFSSMVVSRPYSLSTWQITNNFNCQSSNVI